MTIFDADSPWQSYVDEAWARTSVQNGFVNETDCPAIPFARALPQATCGEVLATWGDPASGWEDDWVNWAIFSMWDVMAGHLRQLVIDATCTRSAPVAAIIYQRFAEDLSDQQKATLWGAFSETMPVTASRLAGGA